LPKSSRNLEEDFREIDVQDIKEGVENNEVVH